MNVMRVCIEQAYRVRDRRSALAGVRARADDRRRVAVERVEVDRGRRLGVARRVPDAQDVVHRREHEAIAHAQRLVGRFHRKLVAAVREALLEEIETIEAADDLGVRLGLSVAGRCLATTRCVRDRAEDLEEVAAMIEAGETDIALDELRWLLSGCSEFIAAHTLAGDLARLAGDVPLARGHYGTGYNLGLQALRRAQWPKPLLYSQPANRPFFEAGRATPTTNAI